MNEATKNAYFANVEDFWPHYKKNHTHEGCDTFCDLAAFNPSALGDLGNSEHLRYFPDDKYDEIILEGIDDPKPITKADYKKLYRMLTKNGTLHCNRYPGGNHIKSILQTLGEAGFTTPQASYSELNHTTKFSAQKE